MQTVKLKIRGIEFGTGMPKVCVPIVEQTKKDILKMVSQVIVKKPDCIELRIDWFEDVMDMNEVLALLKEVRTLIGDTVLLFTFRTEKEGGEAAISSKDYKVLYENVCQSGYIDIVDVETYMEEGMLAAVSKMAHNCGVYVIASNHDFSKTPSEEEIVKRLQYMDEEGADIPKIAVMPQNKRDVLILLSATLRYYENGGKKPVITMSMGEDGVISRLSGEIFGSAMTFASVGKASAPGQLAIEEVRQLLDILNGKQ